MMRKVIVILMVLCIGLVTGCAKRSKKQVVAVVNGKEITIAMVDKKIRSLPQSYQTFAGEHKREVVDDMIIEQLLYEEATRRNLEHNPEIKELIAEAEKKIIISKLIEDETKKAPPVSEDDITKYYDGHKDAYAVPEEVRAYHILTNTEEEARKALDELRQGGDFSELAKKYSKDLTKDRGGDLGYFRKGQMIPEFESVCFSLKVGETSDVVKTRFGYHVIKLIDHKDATYRPLDEVKEVIRTLITRDRHRQKFEEFTNGLRNKANVKIDDKVFATTRQPKNKAPQMQPKEITSR